MTKPERVVYNLNVIGSNTLMGMRCRLEADDRGRLYGQVDSVAGKHIVVNYFECRLDRRDLVEEISQLYMDGAVKVTLVEWERQRKVEISGRMYTRAARPKINSLTL